MTAHSSEIQNQDNIERINEIILSFQAEKITYNGVEGFFIPLLGWKNLSFILNDYVYSKNVLIQKNKYIQELEKLEIMNFKLKTALGVAISFDVGISLLSVGLGILCWNLAKIN